MKGIEKSNLLTYRKSDRLLITYIKFDHAHIKQIASSPDYEIVVTNEEDLFHVYEGRVYVTENIKDAILYEDIILKE